MTQKSFSLPKIASESTKNRDEAGSPSGKRINKDIHKTKWSMSPKCLL